MDHDLSTSSPTRKSSTSSRDSSISSVVSEYSLLILSLDQKTVPFPPVEWCTDPFPVSKHWTQISDSQTSELIKGHAIDLFRANQSQHGTNVVVRMDLQYNELTDQYSSTSITQLPDLESQTPALVAATVPGGAMALTTLLATLKRQGAKHEIPEVIRGVLDMKDNEEISGFSKADAQGMEATAMPDIVQQMVSLHSEVDKINSIPGIGNQKMAPPKSMQPAAVA